MAFNAMIREFLLSSPTIKQLIIKKLNGIKLKQQQDA